MAIYIDSIPDNNDLMSIYRPIEYTVGSNNGNVKKMKCFIYLNGSGTADNADNPIILDPNVGTSGATSKFTFDISAYLRGVDSLSHELQTKAGTLASEKTSSYLKVNVSWTEVETYNSGGNILLRDAASFTSSIDIYVLNGVWGYDENTNQFDNFILDGSTDNWLSNRSTTRTIGLSESDFLSGFVLNNASYTVRVETFNSLGGSQNSGFLNITANKRFDVGVGAANLNATTSANWVSLNKVSITSGTAYYTVRLYDLTGVTPYSEEITYNVDVSNDEKYTRIKFLNKLGAYEYFTFKGNRDRSIETRKNYYGQPLNSGYSIGDGGDRVLDVDSRTEFTVFSQGITESDRIWLEEMFQSIDAYVEEGSNYIPIKIRAGKTRIIREGAGLFTIQLTYQYANKNRTQNG